MNAKANIAVLGAGLMGHGIAQVFACAGHPVTVYDPVQASLETLHSRIAANLASLGQPADCLSLVSAYPVLADAVRDADVVFEAALEDISVKQALFEQVEAQVRPGTILASNTSVMPITSIMAKLNRRGRALGTHWWNPPFLIPLVEVVATQWTGSWAVDQIMTLLATVGKTPVRVEKDVPGFIGNRLQHALWREAIALVEEGICSAQDVDTVVKSSFGLRLGVLGPLENADLVGTDLTLAIHRTVLPAINSRPAASPYLEALVASGKLGMKTGEGFRCWTRAQQDALRADVFATLKNDPRNTKTKKMEDDNGERIPGQTQAP
jgi:3-hydroxybutyryl-CoA dehydrogenase